MLLQFVVRNLKKHPFLSFIKILGLALGLSGILFISLFLKNELTYDTFHSKADRIYRFTLTNPSFFGNNHFARIYNSEQLPDLAEYFPEIESYVRLTPIRGGVIMSDEKFYSINEAFVCDSSFFMVFDAEMLIGNKQTVLNSPGSMVISASFSKKVFGNSNPIGKILTIPAGQYYEKKSEFTIKGVMKDFPQNSHFHPELITTSSIGEISGWAWSYLLLKENSNPEKIISGFPDFWTKYGNQPEQFKDTKAYLQPITEIHLRSDKLREIEINGNMTNIYVLAIAAILLLLISISNYAGLNLGMVGFKSKFISMNRVLGSRKNINLKYLSTESIVILALSFLLTVIVSLPVNTVIKSSFGINLFDKNIPLIFFIVIIFGIIGLLAGIQPIYKQYFNNLISGNRHMAFKTNNIFASKGIIVSQFTFTIVLIASVFIISKQTNYLLKNSLGATHNNVICFESVHSDVQQKFELFKSELLKNNSIEVVSAMLEPPGGEANDVFPFEMDGFNKEANPEKNMIGVFPCDYSFATLFNLNFLSGTNFSEKNNETEGSGEYIINEAAMRYLDYNNPKDIVGKEFKLNFDSPGISIPKGKIIGVVSDFHLSTMKKKVGPLVMFKRDKLWLLNFVVSYKGGMRETALSDIQQTWQNLFPAYPLTFEHVGSLYRKVYKTELLQSTLLSIFTVVSLFICCMGLLGLSLITTQQRIKEIGIRKVNGAKISEILTMLNWNFLKWIVVAFIIATPIAYYAMNKWLENFAYKTGLSWWIFALAGLTALGIALLTVSFQSWKAATKNPVESLRYE